MATDQADRGGRSTDTNDIFSVYIIAIFFFVCIALSFELGTTRPVFLTLSTFLSGAGALIAVLRLGAARGWPLVVAPVFVFLFWAIAFPPAINGTDDNAAYLIFADAFFGSLQESLEPLSERRLFSVGAQYAFQGTIMNVLGMSWLTLHEPVFGLVLFVWGILIFPGASNTGRLLCIAVLGLAPVFGSQLLANTSSAFVLGSLSFFLLVYLYRIAIGLEQKSLFAPGCIAIVLMAMLFRPTTAPFNFLVLAAILSYSTYFGHTYKPFPLLLSIISFVGFFLAVYQYHGVFGTYLYPLMGRGIHLTASDFGHIASGITTEMHVRNITTALAGSPLFLTSTALFFLVIVTRERRAQLLVSGVFAIYVVFTLLMIYATSGVASMRYVGPVSLAVILFLLLSAFSGEKLNKAFAKIPHTAVHWSITALIVFALIGARGVADSVAENRLAQFTLPPENVGDFRKVAAHVNQGSNPDAPVLLSGVNHGRFFVDILHRSAIIMDQPGMLTPWKTEETEYTVGLNRFLEARSVQYIISHNIACNSQKAQHSSIGWAGAMQAAAKRNTIALCSLGWSSSQYGAYQVWERDP